MAVVLAVLGCMRYGHAVPSPAPASVAPSPAATVGRPAVSPTPASAATLSGPAADASVAPPAPAAAASDVPVAAASTAPAAAASGAPGGAAETAPAAATSPVEDGPPRFINGEDINWGKQIFTTIVWLGMMCVGIWFILRAMYGRMGMPGFGAGPRRNIQVLDRHMLGSSKALLLVQVPGKVLLLGMTDHQISTLSEIAPEDLETAPSARVPFAPRADRPSNFENPPDNIVDLAGLFGRRASSQSTKGEELE